VNLRIWALASIVVITAYACDGSDAVPSRTAPPSAPSPDATIDSASPTLASATPAPSPAPASADEPIGWPLDPEQPTDAVAGEPGARFFDLGAGPSVREASTNFQTLPDDVPDLANMFGWNCRTHVEYEATPAVDWYVPAGTPVYATMDGDATLYINTHANAFDYYGVDREPYIGNPDRARAPVVPFPGPGGGMGVYVSVTGEAFRTDYGHLSLDPTLAAVPPQFFVGDFDYQTEFAAPRTLDVSVATWRVRRGDLIGYTGDAGYSEAPHLHYELIRLTDGAQLCPTSESGFVDGGWLER
jgi:murein DD-endopeptidase MepM/ murein hydrolase activator NlpD